MYGRPRGAHRILSIIRRAMFVQRGGYYLYIISRMQVISSREYFLHCPRAAEIGAETIVLDVYGGVLAACRSQVDDVSTALLDNTMSHRHTLSIHVGFLSSTGFELCVKQS